MPSQNFDSTSVETTYFDTIADRLINLDTAIQNNVNNYDLIVDGFGATLASHTYFRQFNTITISGISLRSTNSASFIIEPVIISASPNGINIGTTLTGSFLQYNRIMIPTTQPLLFQNGSSAIFNQYNTITAYPNVIINASNIFISTGSVFISASPLAYQYYLLSYFDGSLVSTLDSLNLSEMDYRRV